MTRIGILGSHGRMGQAVAIAAAQAGSTVAGGNDADVLVDFTTPAAVAAHLAAARKAGVPLLIGTTGLGDVEHALIDEAAVDIAVLQAANTSLGVNLLAALVEQAAARLGDDWDVEVLEMHHRHKVDAPSGTALLLGEAAARGRGNLVAAASPADRSGTRQVGSIGFASLRGGSVAGDHLVILAGDGERIELGHRAESREIFARGAVRAAQWLVGRRPGRYTMTNVLGL